MGATENYKKTNDLIKKKLKRNNNTSIKNICCCYSFCSGFFKKIKNCSLNISILNQFILYFIPVIIIIIILIIIIHLYFFSEILKFDFYTIIKEEFLRYFISELDDINLELNSKNISLLFEDISNLIFFKLYFDELNTYGLFENDNEKIFPNISNLDMNIYKSLEKYNNIFTINKNMSEKYIDSRNDSLSELAKIYYHFFPIIASETNLLGTIINQSYLIAYEYDKNKEKVENMLYFNYPRIIDNFLINNNFYPYNNLIAPKISNNQDCENDENYKQFYDIESNQNLNLELNKNWFTYADCSFRKESNYLLDIEFYHLNENNKGSINKTNIITLQTYIYNNENKKYVIDLIYFLNQNDFENYLFDNSVFLITEEIIKFQKYSDKKTYVLDSNDIIEISLSSILNQYFHFGIYSVDNSFHYNGIFYDNININELSEPSKKYSSIDGISFDLRYFSSFYLYTKLFELSTFSKGYVETDNIYYYIFNDSIRIKEVCSKFDFRLYINSLDSNNIDCFDNRNLLYYSRENIKSFFSEGLTLPYCICLPLYCIKNLNENFDKNTPEFVDEIILPERCQNNLLYFDNGISKAYLNYLDNKETKDISNIGLRIGENLDEQLEIQYINFIYGKKTANAGLDYVLISIVDNNDIKQILIEFVEKLNKISKSFTLIIIFGTFLIFMLISILLIIYINSIANVIFEYKEKINYFWKKLTGYTNLNEPQKKSEKDNIKDDKQNNEKIPLLSFDERNIEDNELIDDLCKIYCKFNKISEDNFLEGTENILDKKIIRKISKLNNSNELFKLFIELSLYIPNFKLDINMDYDFYQDSKLVQNYKKNISQKADINEYKEQILYTKSIIKELLSTELVTDYGFITNLNFNYITNINLNKEKNIKNDIQIAIFKRVEKMIKKRNYGNSNEKNSIEYNDIKNIKIIYKNKNIIIKKLEEKFEQDDYLNLKKLDSSFNRTLINSFYNYTKKIIFDEQNL